MTTVPDPIQEARQRWVREEFKDSTGNVTNVEWRLERDGVFVWSQIIHPEIERAVILSQDEKVKALVEAASSFLADYHDEFGEDDWQTPPQALDVSRAVFRSALDALQEQAAR
jgi:hypothetical protein